MHRRFWLAIAAVPVIALGLLTHAVGTGPAWDAVGDGLYAVLAWLVVSFIAPRLAPFAVAGIAWLLCAAVEFAQLTGIPARLAAEVPAVHLVLGSGFDPVDLAAYAVGALLAAAIAAVLPLLARGRFRGPSRSAARRPRR